MLKQSGQTILILILVMTVALSIGLSIVQKSLVDVSTASKVEQSSRAFSAAEAGIEKALGGAANCQNCQTFTDTRSEITEITGGIGLIPKVPITGGASIGQDPQQAALEFPPLAKEDVSQVWLADYTSTDNPPPAFYTQNSLDIYWGTSGITDLANKPAIEVKVIYYASGIYQTKSFYLDSNSSRAATNGFTDASSNCSDSLSFITTTSGSNRQFYCKSTITGLNPILMLMRIRLLYSSTSQPFAVQAVDTCGKECSIPPQARRITATGASGETQRKVNVFQLNKVVPSYFDYAIFSAGDITK